MYSQKLPAITYYVFFLSFIIYIFTTFESTSNEAERMLNASMWFFLLAFLSIEMFLLDQRWVIVIDLLLIIILLFGEFRFGILDGKPDLAVALFCVAVVEFFLALWCLHRRTQTVPREEGA